MALVLRPYRDQDLEPAIALWQRAWTAAMPEIDFASRVSWWRTRWSEELLTKNRVVVAEEAGELRGFVVIDPKSGWLDQIVVEPTRWGSGVAERLIEEAKRLSPSGINLDVNQSNARAVRFYERVGFMRTGEGVNTLSGRPTFLYEWKPLR